MTPLLRTAAAAVLGTAGTMGIPATSHAAELHILAGGGIMGPLRELVPQFETATGHKLVLRFGTTPELIRMATSGDAFDLAVVPREVFKDAAAQAKFVAGPTTDVARVGLGVAVKAGTAKPDISTPDALKAALLAASSVASIPASAAGAQVIAAYDALGIADAMKAKTKAQAGPAQLVEAIAKGDADLGVFLINVLTAPGLDVVGPFPAGVQREVSFTSAVATGARNAEAAKAFLDFLRTPAAATVIKAKGMTAG